MRLRPLAAALAALALLPSCAYYNTFYKAKTYYAKGTEGAPYVLQKVNPSTAPNFTRSIDYSRKVIAQYPKSKWVDDAYLLWGKALIGKDDPVQTMNMLGEFATRYPDSPLRDEALFYFGVAGRKARKYPEALAAIEEFLKRSPRHKLQPYAYVEQAQILAALKRHRDAAEVASRMMERYPKHKERNRVLELRADALLALGDHERARADYKELGLQAASDLDRFAYLLKEADCLESARLYDQEMALLREALGHEEEPQLAPVPVTPVVPAQPVPGQPAPPPPPPQQPTYLPATPSNERWGRLMMRIATVHILDGRPEEGLAAFRTVVTEFPQSWLAPEAQYRIGFYYETVADDLEAARLEYAKVAQLAGGSPYTQQANDRLANLLRLTQVRAGAGTDSVAKVAEAGFMRAELYLFQNNRPERAVEEYRRIVDDYPGTAWAGKAINAQAWVLRRKMEQPARADSLWWAVVREYPRTVAQLDARDYLEREGHVVPDSLIVPPEPAAAPPDTGRALTPPPPAPESLVVRRPAAWPDSLRGLPLIRAGDPTVVPTRPRVDNPDLRALMQSHPDSVRARAQADSLRVARADSVRRARAAAADTTRSSVPADSSRSSSPPDTARSGR